MCKVKQNMTNAIRRNTKHICWRFKGHRALNNNFFGGEGSVMVLWGGQSLLTG